MDYGRAIRIMRAARNVSQRDLAKQIKRNASYISLIEAGQRIPSQAVLVDISRILEVPFHLFTLLASTPEEVPHLGAEEGQALGKALLDLLLDWDPEKKD